MPASAAPVCAVVLQKCSRPPENDAGEWLNHLITQQVVLSLSMLYRNHLRRLAIAFLPLAGSIGAPLACTSDPPASGSSLDGGETAAEGGVGASDAPATDDKDATSNDAAVDANAAQAYCDALASRATCPDGTALQCDEPGKCIYGEVMLPEASAFYSACRAAPSCKDDDECVEEAGRTVGAAAADAYTAACLERHSKECANAFSLELCGPSLFAYPGAGTGAQACLAMACAEIESCIRGLPALVRIAECKD